MKIAVAALTQKGSELAAKVGSLLGADVYIKKEFSPAADEAWKPDAISKVYTIDGSFAALVGQVFHRYDAHVFIMASGIVVRSIAPYLKDKTCDPAVLVMDEKGSFVISLLSGHIGGANRLAREIAAKLGATPVITTATDVNDVVAFDVFAVDNDCIIENIKDLKYISSELVNGGCVGLFSDYRLHGVFPGNIAGIGSSGGRQCRYAVVLSNRQHVPVEAEKVLYIRPKNLVLGVGCKKGTSCQAIEEAVNDFFKKNNRSFLSVKALATVDVKQEEEGILEFCKKHGMELRVISRERIQAVEGHFTSSEFVKGKIGVGSVCEPCSVLAEEGAVLKHQKTIYKGITLALSEIEREYSL